MPSTMLTVLAQSAVNAAPITDTIRALLIPAVVAIGVYVVVRAIQRKITEAIIVGVCAVIGLGITGMATMTDDIGGSVARFFNTVF